MRIVLAGAVTLAACGRVGFDAADVRCSDGAIFCDDFARTTPAPIGDPVWAAASCADGQLSVDGSLVVRYPMTDGTGTECTLDSRAAPVGDHFELGFDLTFDGGPPHEAIGAAQLAISLAAPDPRGVEQELIQLLLWDDGQATISLVYYYPDASQSPDGSNYPGWDIADSAGEAWLVPGVPCRLALWLDTVDTHAEATATCGGRRRSLTPRAFAPRPTGLDDAPVVSLGYLYPLNPAAAWRLRYDDFVLRGP